jgi:hypothetical protein
MSRKSSIPSTPVIFGDNPSFEVDSSPCAIPVTGSIMLLLEEDTRSLVNVGLLRKELGRHVGTFRSGTKPSHLMARKATIEMKSLDIFFKWRRIFVESTVDQWNCGELWNVELQNFWFPSQDGAR